MQGGNDRLVRRTSVRLFLLIAALLAVGGAILPEIVGAQSPYSTISPASDQANDIQDIYKLTFWLSLIVFVGVQIGIIYTALRYRQRRGNEDRPEQVHGNKTIEIIWTIIPAIILLIIFIPTVRTIYAHDDQLDSPDLVIEVYGKQWWWEIHYPSEDGEVEIVTANEVRVPEGKRVVFHLFTNNVIHSFWVPQLSGKMDLIPGHVNQLAIDTDTPGYYFGQCAEYCGDSHALMRFKVIVEPEEQFLAWQDAWRAGPTQASGDLAGGDIASVPESMALCMTCHEINGAETVAGGNAVPDLPDELDAARTFGPNLSLLGCRTTIAAGTLTNTEENLTAWLHDPESIKPGNYMGTVIKPGALSDDQIQEIVTYLGSLTPDGGCSEIPVQPGVDQQVQVTDPD